MKYHTWPTVALGSRVKFLSGGTPSKSVGRYWNGDIPWIGSGEMSEPRIYKTTHSVTYDGAQNGTRLVPPNTVLIVVRGMSLAKECRVSLTTRESTFNQDVKSLSLSSGIDPFFAFYYLRSQRFLLRDAASEAAHGTKKLDMPVLEQWPFPDVPYPIQRKIAAILTAYDDLIGTNKLRIALLEKMAEEIYREWFVRLRFPGYQNTRFVKGVPEGWETKRFSEFCVLKRGYDLPDASVEDGPYPVVASTSIKTYHNDFKVKPPVITTGRSGSLGEVLITFSKAWPLNTSLYVRDFLGNSPFYIFFTLRNIGLDKFNSGAGVPTLNRNHLNGLPIVVPSKKLQQYFDEIAKPIFEQVENLRLSNEALSKTRDLLLPRLISGKLSVEDLDIQFPPSMQEDTAAAPAVEETA